MVDTELEQFLKENLSEVAKSVAKKNRRDLGYVDDSEYEDVQQMTALAILENWDDISFISDVNSDNIAGDTASIVAGKVRWQIRNSSSRNKAYNTGRGVRTPPEVSWEKLNHDWVYQGED